MPLKIKLSIILSAIGAGTGSLIGFFYGRESIYMIAGTAIGSVTGFIFGYHIGRMIKEVEDIARTERFTQGIHSTIILLGWLFVAIGVFLLIIEGWKLPVFISTLFFLIGSIYLTHRSFRARRNL